MFQNIPPNAIVTEEPDEHLMSYSGNKIKCIRPITFDLRKKLTKTSSELNSTWLMSQGQSHRSPTCISLDLVKLNVDGMCKPKPNPPKFHSIADVQMA